jgi:hypothetical protein
LNEKHYQGNFQKRSVSNSRKPQDELIIPIENYRRKASREREADLGSDLCEKKIAEKDIVFFNI